MANGTIVGRENEKRLLTQIYNSNKAELTALYGRRRVGKTFLLKTFFDGKIDFNFSGLYQTDKNIQLEFFVSELRRVNKNISPDLKVKSWLEAFELLREYLSGLKKDKIVVFLDELPWMDTPKSNFMQAFSYFWNTWGCTFPALKLFVCGSATTWMMSKLIGDKGGLYGRCTKIIYLSPFTLGETEQFLSQVKNIKWTRFQILECYMILGGIPYYLDLLSKGVKFSECIDNLIFNSNGPLRIEFDFLYRSLFKDASFYRKIIEILSSKLKGLTRDEIKAAMKIKSGGSLTDALNDLCSCDFIREYTSFGKTGKQSLFQLTDLFSLFYLHFVDKKSKQDEHYWSNIYGKGEHTAWAGYAFEQVCLHHIRQIKEKLGISGVKSDVYGWAYKPTDKSASSGAQIDLLIDRDDNVISVCEMKYTRKSFRITSEYNDRIQQRMSLFAQTTKTRKALWNTFVSASGIEENEYANEVQNVVTMEDLFGR